MSLCDLRIASEDAPGPAGDIGYIPSAAGTQTLHARSAPGCRADDLRRAG
jgi:enoyl-CoA hydratase/carnithine racemase